MKTINYELAKKLYDAGVRIKTIFFLDYRTTFWYDRVHIIVDNLNDKRASIKETEYSLEYLLL